MISMNKLHTRMMVALWLKTVLFCFSFLSCSYAQCMHWMKTLKFFIMIIIYGYMLVYELSPCYIFLISGSVLLNCILTKCPACTSTMFGLQQFFIFSTVLELPSWFYVLYLSCWPPARFYRSKNRTGRGHIKHRLVVQHDNYFKLILASSGHVACSTHVSLRFVLWRTKPIHKSNGFIYG